MRNANEDWWRHFRLVWLAIATDFRKHYLWPDNQCRIHGCSNWRCDELH